MILIIVESPTKAKTIEKFLGSSYKLESSFGHIRDLPKKEMGIEIENNFKPKYVIPDKAKKKVGELKMIVKKVDSIILATDEDREGEAIAWHLTQALNLKNKKVERIVFHEITKEAILNALKAPQKIDINLVDAQQGRRILDRLVGYELSPFLWKKVARGLSAGRVQSVAVRLIVDREREIEAFKSEEYWTVEARLQQKILNSKFETEFLAMLIKKDKKTISKLEIKTKEEADKILKDLEEAKYKIIDIKKREIKKNPNAPFITSTLQQEANHKLGFSAKQTMMIAQQLYEGIGLGKEGSVGLITYMRTDSFNLAENFLEKTQNYIKENFGSEYALEQYRRFKIKSKLSQEAHEAIRPTEIIRSPEMVEAFLDKNQFKLYQLIWRRTLACQMKEAIFDSTSVDIEAKNYIFRASGSIIKFDGFLKIYPSKTEENILPSLEINEILALNKLISNQHFTQPPGRYNEATLIKALEENGIGRPSTYAPTISTIVERNYIIKENKYLKPTDIGILVNDLLVEHFPKIVDIKFTAQMENNLDEVAQGKVKWQPIIKEFYDPFKKNLIQKEKEVSKKALTEKESDEKCDKCDKPMIIKVGRFGKFLACTGFPDCKNTKPLEKDLREMELSNEKCDKCGADMIIKHGRFGAFLSCSKYPECKNIKSIKKSTGVKCPQCNKGEIVEKKSKKGGRTFYACDQYPNCKFALWQKPVNQKCDKCGSLMVMAKDDEKRCSNKECKI
ncbi:type I DNA topoisomerase [Candidatus Kuenenbacteria bacterium HGW-Kuenenbacteria-1]|uniref:DNA topoisomerase 1 n=1 Tax=Candidatus Kuenenbacteria bacterium HGW-Kuenenbacteria-1 TaxID=2013812 RepID=A0A2N1UPB9_9BACT|nr:MAG: type I DNA topoisomerase [Candidatus Kuenenbacteria bacterium HGW-Kuenenbacteria-1]